MIQKLNNLPTDEVDSFDDHSGKNCSCAGVSKCVVCTVHSHRLTRRLCDRCWHNEQRAGRLEQYPLMRLDARVLYEKYIELKREDPKLTIAQAAGKLEVNKMQLTNALARQRRKRGIEPIVGGQYVDWHDSRPRS